MKLRRPTTEWRIGRLGYLSLRALQVLAIFAVASFKPSAAFLFALFLVPSDLVNTRARLRDLKEDPNRALLLLIPIYNIYFRIRLFCLRGRGGGPSDFMVLTPLSILVGACLVSILPVEAPPVATKPPATIMNTIQAPKPTVTHPLRNLREAQQGLLDHGYDIGPSGVDGLYGPDTQRAWDPCVRDGICLGELPL